MSRLSVTWLSVVSRSARGKHLCLAATMMMLYAAPLAAMNTIMHAGDNSYCSETQRRAFTLINEALPEAELDDSSPDDVNKLSYESRGITSDLVSSANDERTVSLGFDYSYTILGYDGTATPDTNGHLHTIIIPIKGRQEIKDHSLMYHLAPALSASSNVLKDPTLIDTEALQLRAGLRYGKTLDDKHAWFAGLRADYRFGPYRVYPVAGYCWKPGDSWRLQLGLPDLRISRQIAGGVSIGIFASPVGNRWHVFNKDKTRSSDLGYNAIASGITVDWQINRSVGLSIGIISHSRRRMSYLDQTGTAQDTSASSATGYTAAASIMF